MVKVLTVNIGAASVERARRQLAWLQNRLEDVFILTETSSGPGTQIILDHYRKLGFAVKHVVDPTGDRGVALISRIQFRSDQTITLAGVSLPSRTVIATLSTTPAIYVVGIYVPSRDRSVEKTDKKRHFMESLLQSLIKLPLEVRRCLILGGDYNVIDRDHQPQYRIFLPFERDFLSELERLGINDAHKLCNPGFQAYTWVGRTEDGYRYDYFNVGAGLTEKVRTLEYDHSTRTGAQRITDHSAAVLEINIAIVDYITPLSKIEQQPLF